jgi:hypothetical protein
VTIAASSSSASQQRGQGVTPQSWAISLLTAIGAPTTQVNVQSIIAWEAREGGNWNNTAQYNPLNTTQTEPGSYSINPVGVQAFPSWAEGLSATISTLNNGDYNDILQALHSGKGLFGRTFAGLSTWSGGGYDTLSPRAGYGGGSGTTVGQAAQTTAAPASCAIAIPSYHIDLFFGMGPSVGGGCVMSKSQARAVFAVANIGIGAALMLAGLGLMLAMSRVTRIVVAAAGNVPGAGPALRGAAAASGGARGGGSTAPVAPGSAPGSPVYTKLVP